MNKMLEVFYRIQKIYYLVLAAIGVCVNSVSIFVLCRGNCGLSKSTTLYFVTMGATDMLVVFIEVILWQMSKYYFPESFLNFTSACKVVDVLARAAINCSVWFTVAFTFDRFVAICCEKLKAKYCSTKTGGAVLTVIFALFCFKSIPFYFTLEPGEVMGNERRYCRIKPTYYTEPFWVGYEWFDKILTPLLPFALVLLFNALTVRYILVSSRVRKGLKCQNTGGNRSDPELESRRKSMILLFTVSGSFILLWLVFLIEFLRYTIAGSGRVGTNISLLIFEQVGYMLVSFSCCTNTFIYGVSQSKFRQELHGLVKSPWSYIIQYLHKVKN